MATPERSKTQWVVDEPQPPQTPKRRAELQLPCGLWLYVAYSDDHRGCGMTTPALMPDLNGVPFEKAMDITAAEMLTLLRQAVAELEECTIVISDGEMKEQ